MAWPKSLNRVRCTGFPKERLEAIAFAIDQNRVKWLNEGNSLYGGLRINRFTWVGETFELIEEFELVTELRRIA